MKRVRLAILLALFGLSLVVLYHRGQVQVWARGADQGVRELVGKPAPELPRGTLGRGAVRLADLRGRVVLLHFWTYG